MHRKSRLCFSGTLQPPSDGYWTSIKTILQILRCLWKWFRAQKSIMNIPKLLSAEEAQALTAGEGSSSAKWFGIETPDDYTVVYHCTTPKPYFDTVCNPMLVCTQCPKQWLMNWVSRVFRKWTTRQCGITVATPWLPYVQGNGKSILPRIPLYWDTECSLFNTVTIKVVESNDVAFQLYQTGEVDYVDLTEVTWETISGNANNGFYDYLVEKPVDKYSYQIHFNYSKNKETELRIPTGIPLLQMKTSEKQSTTVWTWQITIRVNAVNPMNYENNFYTMKGLRCYIRWYWLYRTGRQEMEACQENNGETMIRLDAEKAEEYKQAAIEELALGAWLQLVCGLLHCIC